MSKIKKIHENIRKLGKHSFFRDFLVLGFLFFSSFLLIVLFTILFLGIKPSGVLVQTRFNSFSGVVDLGSWYNLYNIFIVGFLIFITNIFLAYFFYNKERLASLFLLIAAIFAEIILIVESFNFIKLINS